MSTGSQSNPSIPAAVVSNTPGVSNGATLLAVPSLKDAAAAALGNVPTPQTTTDVATAAPSTTPAPEPAPTPEEIKAVKAAVERNDAYFGAAYINGNRAHTSGKLGAEIAAHKEFQTDLNTWIDSHREVPEVAALITANKDSLQNGLLSTDGKWTEVEEKFVCAFQRFRREENKDCQWLSADDGVAGPRTYRDLKVAIGKSNELELSDEQFLASLSSGRMSQYAFACFGQGVERSCSDKTDWEALAAEWRKSVAEGKIVSSQLIEDLYKALAVPETGGTSSLDDPRRFIRTKVMPRPGEKASSAYGPAQITKTLAEAGLEAGVFDPELIPFVERFVEQGRKFLNESNPRDPVYGFGGTGDLGHSPEVVANYEKMAKQLLTWEYSKEKAQHPDRGEEQILVGAIERWRGASPSEDPNYFRLALAGVYREGAKRT